MADMTPSSRLAAVASRQHGLFTFEQALEAGFSDGAIRGRRSRGGWTEVRRRVFTVPGTPPTFGQCVLAACLAVPESSASHDTARQLWCGSAGGTEIELSVAGGGRRTRLEGVRLHRWDRVNPRDVTMLDRIPITRPERMVVDLSGRLDVDQLGRMVDDLVRRKLLTLNRIRASVSRLEKAPGRRPAIVKEVLERRSIGDPGDSDREAWVLRTLVAAGLPVPRQQHRVQVDGHTFILDLAYVDERIAIEFDGWSVHGGYTPFHDDRRRMRLLGAGGWLVLPVTARTTAGQLVDSVVKALAHRSAA